MTAFDSLGFDSVAFDTVATVTTPSGVEVIDHVAVGLSRLYQQFRKPGIIALLRNNLERWNDLEQVCQDLLTRRTIFAASDSQEDDIGKIVKQTRNGLSDDIYRRYLFARIATNNSDGTPEDLIKIATLIVNDPVARIIVTQTGIATVYVRIAAIATPDDIAAVLIDLLRTAPLAAVKIVLEWSTAAPGDVFTFDDGPGFDDGFLQGSAA